MADGSGSIQFAATPATSSGSSGSGRDPQPPAASAVNPNAADSMSSSGKRPTSTSTASAFASSSFALPAAPLLAAAPHGRALRRATTITDAGAGAPSLRQLGSGSSRPGLERGAPDRRGSNASSNLSNHDPPKGVSQANGLSEHQMRERALADLIHETTPDSGWVLTPLAFALLPAVGGLMFKNGSAIVTDFTLLGLASVFLAWSLNMPWSWYYYSRSMRVSAEEAAEVALDDYDYDEPSSDSDDTPDYADYVPPKSQAASTKRPLSPKASKLQGPQQSARRELYYHEIMALVACFLYPVLAASLLHGIRTQLSRPSEGLVSNYNLTIFILAAYFRPLRQLLVLIEARSLHLQRIVMSNPYGAAAEPKATASQLAELVSRLNQLEARVAMDERQAAAQNGPAGAEARQQQREAIVREARSQMQPEVDALNRAVRRYEKKQTILAVQLDSRLQMLDGRLDDALALAAHAAKSARPRPGFWSVLADQMLHLLLAPFRGLWLLVRLPVMLVLTALGREEQRFPDKAPRGYRSGQSSQSSSVGTERIPSRTSRR